MAAQQPCAVDTESPPPTAQMAADDQRKPPLGWRNWSNLAAYIVNSVVTYVSLTGIFGETNGDLSDKYHTLVTPAGWAFSIWGVIFVGEAAAVVAQMFPRYRGLEVVRASTPWWLAACGFQVCWTIVFAQEVIWLSVVCMLGILVGLVGMALVTDNMALSTDEYWLLRLPFAVHLGWIVAASALNINVLADASSARPATLLGMAVLALAAVLLVVAGFAILPRRPEPTVGVVAAWALAAIASELADGENLNSPTRFRPYAWSDVTTSGLRFAVVGLAVASGILAVVAIALRFFAAQRSAREARQ
mmetsp:Transcript_67196/g.194315  ORF Transcript_67196/g.194315 Transcript_67196/m.194315 type:complete len:304 (+) Transcript_67196:72-983(+)